MKRNVVRRSLLGCLWLLALPLLAAEPRVVSIGNPEAPVKLISSDWYSTVSSPRETKRNPGRLPHRADRQSQFLKLSYQADPGIEPAQVRITVTFVREGSIMGGQLLCARMSTNPDLLTVGPIASDLLTAADSVIVAVTQVSDWAKEMVWQRGWQSQWNDYALAPQVTSRFALEFASADPGRWDIASGIKELKRAGKSREFAGCAENFCSECKHRAKDTCKPKTVGSYTCTTGSCCACCFTCGTVPPSQCGCGGGGEN